MDVPSRFSFVLRLNSLLLDWRTRPKRPTGSQSKPLVTMEADDCQVPPATEGQAAEGGSPAASQASQQMQDEEFEDDYTPPTSNESRTSGENVASPHNETHSRGELSRTKGDDSGEASLAGQEDSDHPEPAKAAQDGGDGFRPPSGKSSPEAEEVEEEEIVEEVEEEDEEEDGEERGEMEEAAATVVALGAGPPAEAPQVEGQKQPLEEEQPAEEDPDGSLQEYAAALANMEEQDPTPDSSPRTKLSGVLSDAGESSPSNALDTGREFEEISNDPDLRGQCSDAARQVVQEVLAKALQPDTDSDRDSDTGLGSLRQATSSLEHPSPPSFSPPALQLASSATGDGEGDLGYSPAKYRDGGDLPSPRAGVFQEDQKKGEEDEKRDDQMDLEELETPRPDTQRPQADREEEEEDAETGDRPGRKEAVEEEKEEEDDDDQRSLGGDGNDEDDSEAVTLQASPHPEYPMNYGNYKVCRRVSPGVKECLILETGEHIKYCKGRRLFEEQTPMDSAGHDNGAGADSNGQGRKGFKVSRQTTDQGFSHLRLGRSAQLREEEEPEGQAGGDASRLPTGPRPDAILGGPGTRPLSGPGGQERRVAWEERQTAAGSRLSEDEVPVRDVPSQQDHSQEGEEEEEEVEEVRDEIDRLLRQEGFNGLSATSQRLLAEAARNLRRVPHGGRSGLDVSPTATDRYNAGYRSATSAEGVSAPPGGWAGGQPAWGGASANTSALEADLTNMEGSYLGERPRQPLSDRSPRPGLPRFDPYSLASPPAPGSVPSFKTLQEQQVSWMSMFRMLEDQHQRELQSQYAEHSRMIQEIQDQMERQLTHRQSSFSRRLSQHRHFLAESEGWVSHRGEDSLMAPASPSLAAPSPRPSSTPRGSRPSSLQASRLEMYGRAAPLGDEGRQDGRPQPSGRSHPSPPAALKPLLVDYSTEESQEADTEEERERRLPSRSAALHTPPRAAPNRMAEDVVRRAFEDSDEESSNLPPLDPFLSSSDSAVMAARQQQTRRLPGDSGLSQSLLGGDKLLRGGVYSSPMPLSRPHRPRSKAGQEGVDSRNASLLSGGGDGGQRRELSTSRQLDFDMDTTQDSQSSARARTLLREEHSRHLAQLRDYYQQQVQELKSQLGDSAPARQSATEKILREENKDLRRKCSDLADQLEDTKASVRSLEQKVHGLEVRAADYSERYEKAERRLRGLEKQVVDGEDKLREREAQIAELDARTRQQTLALQEAYKLQNNLEESNRRDRSNLQRILEKYENLERDHSILKESYSEVEKKLFETRNQVVDLNKIIASYEMLNKQLTRDNENLHNRLASAVSLKGYKTSYEDSYTGSRANDNRSSYMNGTASARSLAAVNQDHVGELLHGGVDLSAGDAGPSPLLTAERELQRLQAEGQSNTQLLRSHKKFFGSEPALASPAEGGRTPPKVRGSPSSKSKPSSKAGRRGDSGRGVALENGGSSARRAIPPSLNPLSQDAPSAVRFDIDHRPDRKDGSASSGRVDVDRTLERVRAGDVVSRPQWEDVYTSLAKPSREPDLPATQGLSREEKIKERLRAISDLEHRYDDLSAERRRLESGLSKIPVTGRVDRKAKREKEELETRLDSVDKELGSLRMSLKRYQVLKSAQ